MATRTSAATVAPAGWGATIAQASLASLDAEATAREANQAHADAFTAAVQASGESFFQRMAAACGDGAAGFNAGVKGALVGPPRLNGDGPGFSLRAGEQGFVLVTAFLSVTRGAPKPGCLVRHRIHGREGTRSYDLVLADDVLVMRCEGDGDLLNPEEFAERVMTPWLRQLDVAAVVR